MKINFLMIWQTILQTLKCLMRLMMIDKIIYKILGWFDKQIAKVNEVLTFKFPKNKNKKK